MQKVTEKINCYRHLFIYRPIIKVFSQESLKAGNKETGGGLVGYITNDRDVVITYASGPGKKSILKKRKIVLNGEYIKNFADNIYKKSGYKFDYIGDWHRHVGISVLPSKGDKDAMNIISNHPDMPDNPISIIYRARRLFLTENIAAYVWEDNSLKPISITLLDEIPK